MITTAEGGIAVTNDPELNDKMKILRSHGIVRDSNLMKNSVKETWYYEQQLLGFNYRLNDIQAALGLSQLNKLEKFLNKRKQISRTYDENLKKLPVVLPYVKEGIESSMHLYVIQLKQNERNKMINFFQVSICKCIISQFIYSHFMFN